MNETIQVAGLAAEDQAEADAVFSLALQTLRQTYRPIPGAHPPVPPGAPKVERLAARLNGRMVGVTGYRLEGERVHVLRLGVHPEYRKRGVARALVEAAAEMGRKAGARRVSLNTVKETGNVAVFSRLGFTVAREEADLFSESERFKNLTDVYMEREL